MIINLKQAEIVQALRAYVQAQGISLQDKDLTISFTAGRKETGISAEITIEDTTQPAPCPQDAEVAVEEVVSGAEPEVLPAESNVGEVPVEEAVTTQAEVPVTAEVETVIEVDPAPAKTVSLFG